MNVLDARIALRLGDLDLDVTLTADTGDVVALLGPNGAGKTTIVRALSGLLPIDAGRITIDGTVVDDPEAGTFIPPEHRRVGVVFQDHLLFPRMSARDNVAFGLRSRGEERRAANGRAMAWLDRFGLGDQAADRPAALSGGQAQRVALARALAVEPRLLLLDEPLAALDASVRPQVRTELRRHLATFGGARILVTHDPVDALVLADRLVVVEGGRVTQSGTAAEVTQRPATRYIADLVGTNLLRGRLLGNVVTLGSGATLTVAPTEPVAGGEVAVAIRPQAVSLYGERPGGSPRNTWEAAVVELEAGRDRIRVLLGGRVPLVAEVTTAAAAELDLHPGRGVWISAKAVDIDVYAR